MKVKLLRKFKKRFFFIRKPATTFESGWEMYDIKTQERVYEPSSSSAKYQRKALAIEGVKRIMGRTWYSKAKIKKLEREEANEFRKARQIYEGSFKGKGL